MGEILQMQNSQHSLTNVGMWRLMDFSKILSKVELYDSANSGDTDINWEFWRYG